MVEEGSVRRFRPRLTAMLPGGWYAKESINLVAPDGQADVVASSEPLSPSVDTKHYAETQGELLRKEFSGYRELAFMPYRMLGDLEGFIRRFEWTPSESTGTRGGLKGLIRRFELASPNDGPITALQLYYAGSGRGYTVTATTHSHEFERIESQLWAVLNGLALEREHPAPIPDQLHSKELTNFDHSTIETYLRGNDYPFFKDQDNNFQLRFLPDEDSGRELTVQFSAEGSENDVYAIYINADKTIPRSAWSQALLLCNTWNAQKRWPRVCLWVDNPDTDATARLIMDHHIDLKPGINQELFNDLTNTVIRFAFEFWKWASQDWVWQNITDIARLGPEIFAVSLDASTNYNSDNEEVSKRAGDGSEEADEGSGDSYRGEDVLSLCGVSLTDRAQQGRLGHSDRQGALVERVIAALAAEGPSSIMLVGRPDVGKTALMHEVVRRGHAEDVPASLRGREVWFVTANNLIAGMKYIGDWQGRARNLVLQAQAGRQILYMGDPGEILAAGRHSQSDDNLGRFLRPYIESGELTVVCECTPEAYVTLTKTEPSFMRAFRRVDVPETNEADTAIVLGAAARRLEETHGVAINSEATNAVLELSRRFMPYQAFPGKAVRLLETVVQDALQVPAEGGGERETAQAFRRADVVAGFARATGLPAFMLSDEVAMRVPEVRAHFEERLLGQPEAVEAIVDLITVVKASLNDPGKPLGSFFFVGPTGVGKTELAKVLAEFLFGGRERLLRFDMSEYASGDALTRLIGSAWSGDSEGELVRLVREQPFCVVLLDEFEKAHPAVFDVLLGVLGEGRLTGADGRTTDFRNAIVIMTSNLGASRGEMQRVGFGGSSIASADTEEGAGQLESHFLKEAERFFRPEFFNRIDRIVAFRPLSLEAIRQITRRELGKLLMREGIVRRKLLVEIDDAVIEELLTQGFHPLYGAKPLQREIERAVILPLARLVVEKNPDDSHLLRFGIHGGRIQLTLTPLDASDEKTASATAPTIPPERKLETDLDKVLDDARDLRERSTVEGANPAVGRLRGEMSGLLERTYAPTFWDDPATAREVLGRVYHIERVLKRLDALAARAERLEEKGRQIRIHRDRRSVPSFAREVENLKIQFDYLQAELTGAGEGHDQAIVYVASLSRDAGPWAARLLAMYTAWAERKGYEYSAFHTSQPSGETSEEASPEPSALYVKGSNVYELLRGEAGLHKLSSGTAEDRQRQLARVTVLPVQNVPLPDDPAQLHAVLTDLVRGSADTHDEHDTTAFVRIYHEGRGRFVRDPRTGVRLTDVSSVLKDGRIDEFLLASLRR